MLLLHSVHTLRTAVLEKAKYPCKVLEEYLMGFMLWKLVNTRIYVAKGSPALGESCVCVLVQDDQVHKPSLMEG